MSLFNHCPKKKNWWRERKWWSCSSTKRRRCWHRRRRQTLAKKIDHEVKGANIQGQSCPTNIHSVFKCDIFKQITHSDSIRIWSEKIWIWINVLIVHYMIWSGSDLKTFSNMNLDSPSSNPLIGLSTDLHLPTN